MTATETVATTNPTAEHQLPPPIVLLNVLGGMMSTRALMIAAQLGVADHMADGPKSIAELAAETGTHAPSLYRLLRFLASIGIFEEAAPQLFRQTTLSHFLRDGVYGSMRNMARMWGDDWRWQAWGGLDYSVRTGKPATDHLLGERLFQYFAHQNPESGMLFGQAMTSFSQSVDHPVTEAYDFAQFGTVADIGGSHGSLLSSILSANPSTRGILFDLPPVIKGAQADIAAHGLADRCALTGGDFFRAVPSGADAYILKFIIHDWNDEECATILRNCRQAMAPGGKVLVVEQVVPSGNEPSFSKLLDLEMLVCMTGRERTAEEFAALYAATGLRLTRIIPTHSAFSIIEGVAAE